MAQPDYQKRVIHEKSELDEKIDKLATYLDEAQTSAHSRAESARLYRQLEAMRAYSKVLGERIDNFVN